MNRYRTLVPSLLLASLLGFAAAPTVAATHKCAPSEARGDFMEHRTKHMEQHHERLHAALNLTPAQEGAWTKLMDSEHTMDREGHGAREDLAKLTTPERAQRMLERMNKQQAQLTEHVAAITAFYAVLTPEQQKTFDEFHSAPKRGMHGKHGHAPTAKTQTDSAATGKSARANANEAAMKHESAGAYLDDSAITAKVKAAVLGDASLKSAEINVETYKGIVQLTGFVRSRADINEAVQVANGVNGVTSVKNDMIVKGQQ